MGREGKVSVAYCKSPLFDLSVHAMDTIADSAFDDVLQQLAAVYSASKGE